MINKVILIGNLGRDPELTYTSSGTAVCKVSLATTERWTSRDGEKQERTEWHNLVFWKRQAEVANEYLRKGSQIYVEGRISYRTWEDKDHNKRYATDIVVQNFQILGRRTGGEARPQAAGQGEESPPADYSRPAAAPAPPAPPAQEGGRHYEPLPGGKESDDSLGPKDDLPF